jgi:hypothetical protein
MASNIGFATFSILVQRDRMVKPGPHVHPSKHTKQRLIGILKQPMTEFAPAIWYPSKNCNEFFDAVEQLLKDKPFSFDFDFAAECVRIRITRLILIEEAPKFWGELRTYVYNHAFMVKEEGTFKDWFSMYNNAWIVKIDQPNVDQDLMKAIGLVPTRDHIRYRPSSRGTINVFEKGLFMYSGEYKDDCWRHALREAMGDAVELMSPNETLWRVSCKFEPVSSEQHPVSLILQESSLLALQRANNMIGEEEV